ncbi:Oligosaccharyltransferase complex subunit OSTC [Dirofilaria immitis]|nr:Oligosaccharyltransferase complex subunit OSTC [Dirofilaria immitis]
MEQVGISGSRNGHSVQRLFLMFEEGRFLWYCSFITSSSVLVLGINRRRDRVDCDIVTDEVIALITLTATTASAVGLLLLNCVVMPVTRSLCFLPAVKIVKLSDFTTCGNQESFVVHQESFWRIDRSILNEITVNVGIYIRDAMKTRSALDLAKRAAAYAAGEKHVKSGYRIGVGSGTTAKFFVEFLAEKVNDGTLKDIICVPSSFSTRQWLIDFGLQLTDLEKTFDLDLCIDGADEVDVSLNCIKGGGGCLTQEKIVQASAKKFYIIADASKQSEKLGDKIFQFNRSHSVWVAVCDEAATCYGSTEENLAGRQIIPYMPVLNWIKRLEGGEIDLRTNSKEKLDPFITDNNNFILDWNFPKNKYVTTEDLAALYTRLKSLPDVAEKAYFATADGNVTERIYGIYSGGFSVHIHRSPNVRIVPPRWLKMPSPMQMFALVMMTYFFVTGGVIYDIINEPPSIGQTTDEKGNAKPVAIMQHRVNGQYIMEGLAASFMFSLSGRILPAIFQISVLSSSLLSGLGFIILDKCNNPLTPKLNRIMMLGLGFASVLIGFLATRLFMKIKMPSYLQGIVG